MYRMHEWINVSVSSRFPEKGRGGAIFGSLNEDRAGGVCGNGICDGEKRGGIGSGREPEESGGEWRGKGCGTGENIEGRG